MEQKIYKVRCIKETKDFKKDELYFAKLVELKKDIECLFLALDTHMIQ